jgi:hypothetical protein
MTRTIKRLDATAGMLLPHAPLPASGAARKRPRTRVRATPLGRDAFNAEIYALKTIVGRFEAARTGA